MKIAYNPLGSAAYIPAADNKDLIFDLVTRTIYAKGIPFDGTKYNTFKKHTSPDNTGGSEGLVPIPSYSALNNRLLREDGLWVLIAGVSAPDDALSLESTNSVENKVITKKFNEIIALLLLKAEHVYKNIVINGVLLLAQGANDTLTIIQGDGITLTPNSDNKSIMISTKALGLLGISTSYIDSQLVVKVDDLYFNHWNEVFNWYQSVTEEDTDLYINKWLEIVDFLNNVLLGTNILDEFVTRKTAQIITGYKVFSLDSDTAFVVDNQGLTNDKDYSSIFFGYKNEYMVGIGGAADKYLHRIDLNSNKFRILDEGNYKNIITTNLYWANVPILSASDLTTIPTFGGIVNTPYIRSNSTDGYYIGDRKVGAGTTDNGLLLYSYGENPISLYTKGTERIHITANGLVGIGTQSLSHKLHVVGNAMFNGTIYTNTSYNNYDTIYDIHHTSISSLASDLPDGHNNTIGIGKAGSNNNLGYFSYHHVGDGSASNYIRIGLYGADDILNIVATKNVGIGTTTPNSRLHVHGGCIMLSVNNTWLSPAYLQMGRKDTTVYSDRAVVGVTDGNLHIDAYKGKMIYLNYYQQPSTLGLYNTAVIIDELGNTGIGKIPSHKLHINGTTWIDAGSYVANRATLVLNSNGAPADIIFKDKSLVSGNYGHWALSSRSGEASTKFSIYRGHENTNIPSELEVFTLRPDGDVDIRGTINLWNTACAQNHDEGIRIHASSAGWNALVFCGTDNTGDIGTSEKTWGIYTNKDGNIYINKNSSSGLTTAVLCNVNNNWGIGTIAPSYNLTVLGTTYTDKLLIAISSTDANKYAGNSNYYHLAIGPKAASLGASILLYRADTTTQHAIVWCTGSGDHAGISVSAQSNDLEFWNNKGVLRLKKQTIIENQEHSLQIYKTYNYHPCLVDSAGRPGISISGNYPYLWLTGGGTSNANHGATITLAAPDTAGSTNGSLKTWTFGIAGQNATWMDLAYSVNTTNPHNGINKITCSGNGWSRIMRWNANPALVIIDGNGTDSNGSLIVNSARTGTWIFGASFFAPSMSAGHNIWLNIGKANSTRNSFGLSWHHAGGDGSTSNYGAIEIYNVGNLQRWYADKHTQFLGRVDVANIGYSTYNYDTAAMQIREYGYGGSQTDTWGYAPRLAWHWSGRVAAQIGLASNGYLYTAPATGTAFYKLVYESGTWGINISGNAASAGNADTVDGYHATDLLREFWTSNPGYNGNTYNSSPILTFSYSNNAPYTGVFVDLCSNGYGVMFNTSYHYDSPLAYKRHGTSTDGGMGSWRYLIDNVTIGSQSVNYANNAGTASAVIINYNNDSNSTYQMLWGSGNYVYGTGGIYCNPYTDYLYAGSFYCGGWFRSSGATGWYNESYGGGIYMVDSTWVRIYNGKKFYVSNGSNDAIHSAGGVYVAGCVHAYANYLKSTCSGHTVTIGSLNSSWCHIETSAPLFYFNKSVLANGHFYEYSDIRKKNVIQKIEELDLSKTSIIQFKWKHDPTDIHIGVIAQEIEELVPEVVNTDPDGYKSVDYGVLGTVSGILAIKKISKLLEKIESLEKEIEILKNKN